MPSHQHALGNSNSSGGNQTFTTYLVAAQNQPGYSGGIMTAYKGGDQAHNNMPPYLVVYMWRRLS